MSGTRSKRLFKAAAQVLVGGVNSPVRSFKGVGGDPLVMTRGRGRSLFDADGTAYADYCLSWGALILGHNAAAPRRAAQQALADGSSFGATTRAEIDLARFIVRHVPSIDLVRFVNSGTEATMSAVRLARGYTKRAKIVKFDGCYHGHFDDFLTRAGSGVAGLPASSSEGISAAHVGDTLSLPYNDIQAAGNVIERHGRDIACVIVEPVAGNMGLVLPEPGFLKALRSLTRKHGIILIFDEVMTGFRGGRGCAQEDFGIVPDMTCLGKIIGAGFPVGAYGGRADIMRHLAPLGGVYQAGTFAGNPLVMRAGLAALEELTPAVYKELNARCAAFARLTNEMLAPHNGHVTVYKSMLGVWFRQEKVTDYAGAQQAAPAAAYARLFRRLLAAGIYWPPAAMETSFVSTRHTARDLNLLTSQIVDFFVQSKP